jgi:serine phosphatase RsbU (regulator of sigma subunit)
MSEEKPISETHPSLKDKDVIRYRYRETELMPDTLQLLYTDGTIQKHTTDNQKIREKLLIFLNKGVTCSKESQEYIEVWFRGLEE